MDPIIEQCNTFLKKSDVRFNATISRAVRDLNLYSGDFWSDEFRKKYRRNKNRVNLSMNNWNVMCNAIASPISNSPWHTELVNKQGAFGEIQELIDAVESDNDSKSSIVDAFRKAVLTGYGFLVVTTVEDEISGLPKILLESASHIDAVAFDPTCSTPEGSDAEEGAIINFIPLKKARRLYGEDVAPITYPRTQCYINFALMEQWDVPEDSIAQISYYIKNDAGTVNYYQIVGDKVVRQETLPIKIIPIVRLAGNEIYERNQINYNGIIQQTLSLELGANIAYSTMIERCGRSPKASYMCHVDAIDGLEQSLAMSNQDDAVAVLWKGEHQPVPLTESFQTGDLQATITTCRTLMEDTMGIPLTGITNTQPEKTATEILRQQISKESNTANYYNNAYKAVRMIAKIIIQMVNNGEDLKFTLENGPNVITREMKVRQELSALATIMPDNMKPLIAKYFADSLKNDLGDELSRNIVANLPPDVNFVTEAQDPTAIHLMKQMQAQTEATLDEMERLKTENEDLKQQIKTMQVSMLDNRESRILDFNKFQISEANKVAIEEAKLGLDSAKAQADIQEQNDKMVLEAEKEMNKTNLEHDKLIADIVKGA